MQSRLHSFYEAVTNLALGYILAILGMLVIFPFYGIEVNFSQNIEIAAWFTLISLARQYFLRRAYNRWTEKLWRKMTREKSDPSAK